MFFSKKKIIKLDLCKLNTNVGENNSQLNFLLNRKLIMYLFSGVSPVNCGFSSKLKVSKSNYFLFIPIIKFLISNNVIFIVNNFK